MTHLAILHYPDARLRQIAKPVTQVDDRVRQLVADMLAILYANENKAIGLAAIQVAVAQQVIVMDVSDQRNEPSVFINPEIIAYRGREKFLEGCLSLPNYWAEIERHAWVKVKALNEQGHAFELCAEGLLADCLQHEIDHLQGKLLIDHLSTLKRERFFKQFKKSNKYPQQRASVPKNPSTLSL